MVIGPVTGAVTTSSAGSGESLAESAPTAQTREPAAQTVAWKQRSAALSDVHWVQNELRQRGYRPGRADGVLGPKTRQAIRRYQADMGLPETGKITPGLIARLERDQATAGRQLRKIDQDRIDYFMDVAVGAEYGDKSKIIKKWSRPIIIAIKGEPTQEDLKVLDGLILELGELVPHVEIRRATENQRANSTIHFIPKADFVKILGNAERNSNGFFTVWFTRGRLNKAVILIASDIGQRTRSMVLREELTQSLGILNDSSKYTNSIFHSRTDAPRYSEMDKWVISTLYRRDIPIGMRGEAVRALLEREARGTN